MGSEISRRKFLAVTAAAGAGVLAGCGADSSPKVTDRGAAARTSAAAHSSAISSPTPPKQPVSVTVSESAKAGHADWTLTHRGSDHAVEGFTDKADVLPGEPFALFISATAARVTVEAFRVGWYGGAQARRVWAAENILVRREPKPSVSAGVNTVTAHWQPTLTVHTSGWPEGAYLIRLTCTAGQRYVPLIVRSVDSTKKLLLVHATTTWQAYNTWGGYSLYQGPGGPADYANRARVVSFDRPGYDSGAVKFLSFERSVAAFVDQLRIPTAYTTSAQVHTDPTLLKNAAAIISLGHDEYWSPEMRANVTAARDAGVNIAFLGANACFRRIRFQASPNGLDREVVCYKTDYAKDPLYGHNDKLVTTDYREPPAADPECTLTGTYYEAYPANGALAVYAPNSWLFKGTGTRRGASYPGLIGPEYDRVSPVVPLPRPLQIVAHSPITCKGTHTYSDATYYTTQSGAGVFSAGTMAWTRALLRNKHTISQRTATFATQVTANLFNAFKDGPAADRYRANDNLDEVKPWVGDAADSHHDLW